MSEIYDVLRVLVLVDGIYFGKPGRFRCVLIFLGESANYELFRRKVNYYSYYWPNFTRHPCPFWSGIWRSRLIITGILFPPFFLVSTKGHDNSIPTKAPSEWTGDIGERTGVHDPGQLCRSSPGGKRICTHLHTQTNTFCRGVNNYQIYMYTSANVFFVARKLLWEYTFW